MNIFTNSKAVRTVLSFKGNYVRIIFRIRGRYNTWHYYLLIATAF